MILSVVIPIYNEEESLPRLLEVLDDALGTLSCEHEIVFVDDGSRDRSAALLQAAATVDHRIKMLRFGRNFGHQVAITAGIDHASGDAVVVMDADLQDPPELLPRMVELYLDGYDVVSARRVDRFGDGPIKRATASLFYALMRRAVDPRIVPQVGDFRLFSRAAVEALRLFREQHRFMRGLVGWLGLKEAIIPFHRGPRVAGESKYPPLKMARFAWTAISSFSALPLRISLGVGLGFLGAGVVYLGYILYVTFVTRTTVPGWTSLACLQILLSGATILSVASVGDYVARIYEESKGRPLYVVVETQNLARSTIPIDRAIVLGSREVQARVDGQVVPSETG